MVERCFSLQALCERHENFYSRIIEAAGGKRNLLRLTLSKIRPEMSSPIVSVVMSVLNGERFLREAVESILDQSLREFEFIIINDGSTDFSGSILDSYQHKDPRLRVVHQENMGLVESLNRGCGLARGKYIARMDADDIAIQDRLRWQADFMETHPEVGVVGGAVEVIDTTGRSLPYRASKLLDIHTC